MTSPNPPDPVTLAKIAAQLNPQLACDDPAKAIELARKLLIAADPELAKQAAEQAEEVQLQEETEREDKLFPRGERIPVAEAFKALPPDHYKTENGFAAALRKEKLTTVAQKVDWAQWRKAESPAQAEKSVTSSEVTTIRAVNELFRRQRKAKQARDRERKSRAKEKKSEKCRGISRAKSGTNPPKSGTRKQKTEATKRKAEAPESA